MQLSDWFLAGLTEYDENLTAFFDESSDEIHLCYHKSGKKSLAYSVQRQTGELYPELQRRILKELPLHDIWKRFGSGKSYDDYLDESETKARAAKQRKLDDDRLQKMKESKWQIRSALENARAGRFTEQQARPYEIPSVLVPDIPKEGRSEE